MGYEYKESIKDAVNEVYSASFADELNRKNEIDEVYRKAKSFDQLRVIIEMSMQKDSMYHYYDDHGAFGVDYMVLVEDLETIIKEDK